MASAPPQDRSVEGGEAEEGAGGYDGQDAVGDSDVIGAAAERAGEGGGVDGGGGARLDMAHMLVVSAWLLTRECVELQGAALAGGCALLAACDFVVVAPDAQLGYPVHRIGVSPAVTLPALLANAGAGCARQVTMGGAIVDGAGAVAQGLATQCAASGASLAADADALVAQLLSKGPEALRATKRWLNELDGTGDPARFAHAAAASAAAAEGDEFASMLREFWAKQRR